MCAIIDTNVFGLVFNKQNKEHKGFAPMHAWLHSGRGKLVYGGSKYAEELRGSLFKRSILELSRMGKTVVVSTREVDEYARQLKVKVPNKKFDDPHLAGC